MAEDMKLKVAEAIQDDVNKGIVRLDSSFIHKLGLKPGDVVELEGERKTVAVVDRAYPGDIGLNIVRMDGITRRNAKASIGETVKIGVAKVQQAAKVTIAPAQKGIVIRAPPSIFHQGLLGKAAVKGDIVTLGGAKKRRTSSPANPLFNEIYNMMDESLMGGFGLSDFKFIVTETTPAKIPIVIGPNTEVIYNPEAVEVKEDQVLEVTYEDVGGLSDEVKKIREMVELPLKHPEIFDQLGIEPPKGILLHGPPGTGKTLLAKAVANETNSNFYLINGPEIMSKYYGESEANLRKKFEDAEKNAPSIIFIDEIDAIAPNREEAKGEVERRVVAQLLATMDGLKSRGRVVVIAATNLPNSLDPALRRPGRFDRELVISPPSKDGRLNILKIHTRGMPIRGSLHPNLLRDELRTYTDKRLATMSVELANKNESLQQADDLRKKTEIELSEVAKKLVEVNRLLNTNDEATWTKAKKSLQRLTAEQTKLEDESVVLSEKVRLLITDVEKLTNEKKELSVFKNAFMDTDSVFDEFITLLKKYEDAKLMHDKKDERLLALEEQYIAFLKKHNLTAQKVTELFEAPLSSVKSQGLISDLSEVAEITHGFVGADLSSLTKEAAMVVLRRVLPDIELAKDEPISQDILDQLFLRKEDFYEALKVVRPSALREVLIEVPKTKWDDIGGLAEIKQSLKEAVEWPLQNPQSFARMGIKPPKGVLLYGPPGTGKTLLAKAVANESKANFILVNGPELLSKWVGDSEKAIRKVFEKARQTAPTIIFFDEIDSIAHKRSGGDENVATERVVNQLLTELDGLETLANVVVIAATNRPDIIDSALLRPGRFDRVVYAGVPDEQTREMIFKIHASAMPGHDKLDFKLLASQTQGYVGADIEAVCREAAILALRENMDAVVVTMKHFEQALGVVRASVSPDIEAVYKQLQDKFRQARGKEVADKIANYFG
jgi:CDC48 subfamily AAA family ATPase